MLLQSTLISPHEWNHLWTKISLPLTYSLSHLIRLILDTSILLFVCSTDCIPAVYQLSWHRTVTCCISENWTAADISPTGRELNKIDLKSPDGWPINLQVGRRGQGERTERHRWKKCDLESFDPKRSPKRWEEKIERDRHTGILCVVSLQPSGRTNNTRVCPVRPTFSSCECLVSLALILSRRLTPFLSPYANWLFFLPPFCTFTW